MDGIGNYSKVSNVKGINDSISDQTEILTFFCSMAVPSIESQNLPMATKNGYFG